MWGFTFALALLTCLTSVADAQGGACSLPTSGLPVVDMCEGGSWTLGEVYISVSSTTMGDNSWCNCTLRGKMPTQNTRTHISLVRQGTSEVQCETGHSTTVAWPPAANGSGAGSFRFTCNSTTGESITSPNSTSDVTLTQLRSDSPGVFNYCLQFQPFSSAANNIELTCQGEVEFSTSSSTAASTSSTLAFILIVVAVAAVGWLLVLVLAVLLLLLYLRLRRQLKSSSASGTDNSAYTSLSDVTRSHPRADPNYSVVQSEGSSSQPGGSDAANPRGMYENVEEDSSAVGGQGGERGREAVSGTYYNV